MKSKRGFMLGEYTLKIIIAVICLVLLIYLLYSIYSSYIYDKNVKLAEASLEELTEKMNEAKEKGESEVVILNPTEKSSIAEKVFSDAWWIIAWPYKNGNEKPNQCFGKYCLCICTIPENYKSIWKSWAIRDKSLKECNSLGVCKDFNEMIETINPNWMGMDFNRPIVIENIPLELNIKYNNKEGFEIKEK